MYIIINKTKNTETKHIGNFPDVEQLLNNGDDIIIVSLYSNTIKIPYIDHSQNGYGENIWEWKEYNMELLDILKKLCTERYIHQWQLNKSL